MTKITGICGSANPQSHTKMALAISLKRAADLGCETELLDLRDFSLPLPGFPETGSPEDVSRLVASVAASDGLILATPEYHGSYSSGIKLIIDNLGFPSALKDKPISLLGVASGRIGAIKALEHLSSVCAHIGALVVPGYVSVADARNEFDESGQALLPETRKLLAQVSESLLAYMKGK